jgi:glycosyltransferase involved in cell wall biosynthesis
MGGSVDDFAGRGGDSVRMVSPTRTERTMTNPSDAEAMRPDISLIARIPRLDPIVARSVVGLAGLPTIVATGPFDDRAHAEQLAAAFTMVRRRCQVQLVLLGTGTQRATVLRRALAQGVRTSVHVERDLTGERWLRMIAAADVVVPSVAAEPITLMDVLAAGRPVVAPADPATVQLVVPSSVGLVYRPGDVSGMTRALLRLLASPELRTGMGSRAKEVARRHHPQRLSRQRTDWTDDFR